MSMHSSEPHDLACVIHVHSTFSDGTTSVPEIVEAARETGVDAVLLTDHDTLAAKRRGLEGWHGDVLLLVGEEVSPSGGHFLAFGIEEEIEHAGASEHDIVAAVTAAGGLGFPAHPFSEGSRVSRRIGRPHGWRTIDHPGFTGIELWSLATDTAEHCTSLRELLTFVRSPEQAIDHPPALHLAEWDRLCARRRVVAIGGLDAHQTGLRVLGRGLSPLPHRRFFRLLRTHVLLDGPPVGELNADQTAVLDALRAGRCYLAMDVLADARGFSFWGESGDECVRMGAEVAGGRWTLRARLPREAELRLVRDGRPLARLDAACSLDQRVDGPGVYRLEARLDTHGRSRTWIISNPIYLRPGDGREVPGAAGGNGSGPTRSQNRPPPSEP